MLPHFLRAVIIQEAYSQYPAGKAGLGRPHRRIAPRRRLVPAESEVPGAEINRQVKHASV
jgi:hypothetical protein